MKVSTSAPYIRATSLTPSHESAGSPQAASLPEARPDRVALVARPERASDLMARSTGGEATAKNIPAVTPACILIGAAGGAALVGFTIGQRVGEAALVASAVNGGIAGAAICATAGGLLASVLTSKEHGVLVGAVSGGVAGGVAGAWSGMKLGARYGEVLGFLAGGVIGGTAGYFVGHSLEKMIVAEHGGK